VGKAPPAFGQAEDQVKPAPPLHGLNPQQQARWGQELTDVPQCLTQIDRRVQNLGGQNQVKGLLLETLFGRVVLDVQTLIDDERKVTELLLGLVEKVVGQVREYILAAVCRQQRQHIRS